MIQPIPRIQTLVGYGSATMQFPVNSGMAFTDGANAGRIPLPWPITVRNLVLYSRDTTRTLGCKVTLLKNDNPTGLFGTILSTETGPIVVAGPSVTYAQFDDWGYRTEQLTSTPGWTCGWSVDVDSRGNVFGIPPVGGTIPANSGWLGGALGNGFWQAFNYGLVVPGDPIIASTSYSICATPGTLSTLVLKAYSGVVPVGSTWEALIVLNGYIQDGNFGTVDTRCTITAGNTTAVSTFAIPLVKGDRVDVVAYRTGDEIPFSTAHIGAGIGFVPTSAGYFMLTGGSNDTLSDPGYLWIRSYQGLTTEPTAEAPIGPSGLVARGLYIESGVAGPDADDKVITTVRRNESSTSIGVTITGPVQTSALIDDQFEAYTEGDTINLRIAGADGGTPTKIYWGLEATIAGVGPAAPGAVGVIGPHIWVIFRRTQPDDLGSP